MNGLEIGNGVAKSGALPRICQRLLERALGDSGGLRGDADTPAIERGQGNLVALAFGAQAIFGGDLAIGKGEFGTGGGVNAEFFFFFANVEARRAAFDDKGGNALFGAHGIGIHINDGRVGYAAIGDPGLGAIDDIAIALANGGRTQRGGVGAGLRFGKRVTADALATGEGRQELFFLFFGAEAANRIGVQGILHGENDAGGGAHAGNLFDYDGVAEVIEAGSAVAVRNSDSG